MRTKLLAAAAVMAIGAAGGVTLAASHDDPLTKALAGRTAGAPQTCVENSMLGNAQIIDNRTLLYRESGRRVWRNDLPEACPGLRDDSRMIVEVYGSQLCQNDRFRAVDFGSHIPGPYCRFGKFVPYDKPKT
jgi:hypothetical protein